MKGFIELTHEFLCVTCEEGFSKTLPEAELEAQMVGHSAECNQWPGRLVWGVLVLLAAAIGFGLVTYGVHRLLVLVFGR